jgi:hypothetical protein
MFEQGKQVLQSPVKNYGDPETKAAKDACAAAMIQIAVAYSQDKLTKAGLKAERIRLTPKLVNKRPARARASRPTGSRSRQKANDGDGKKDCEDTEGKKDFEDTEGKKDCEDTEGNTDFEENEGDGKNDIEGKVKKGTEVNEGDDNEGDDAEDEEEDAQDEGHEEQQKEKPPSEKFAKVKKLVRKRPSASSTSPALKRPASSIADLPGQPVIAAAPPAVQASSSLEFVPQLSMPPVPDMCSMLNAFSKV